MSAERADAPARREVDKAARHLSHTYQDALTVADPEGAGRVARQALGEGMGVAGLYQRVIAPAMWRIGELWEQGAISVADEHLATALTHQAMAGIYGPSLGHKARPGRILMAAVEGERHALGLRMAADVVELAGYETIYLGADVPTLDLLQAVAARSPDLICLSATMPSSTPALDRAITEIRRANPRLTVLFGGQGAQPREDDERTVLVKGLEQLLGYVEVALDVPASDRKSPASNGERSLGLGDQRQGVRQDASRVKSAQSRQDADESVERELSGIAAETADLARDLARQASAYKDLAYTDPLCGLPNRRAFEDRAARLRDFSDARPLAVLMVDLDGFKQVNDCEGHEAGDRVLILMARSIAGSLREGDFVARLGGDEFAALLPRTGVADAEALAERLRAEVQNVGTDASVTASVGIAMLEDDVRRALLRADVALYEAKNSGRNVVKRG
jgi:diguanylate cyclase (GGDEF)-like protein